MQQEKANKKSSEAVQDRHDEAASELLTMPLTVNALGHRIKNSNELKYLLLYKLEKNISTRENNDNFACFRLLTRTLFFMNEGQCVLFLKL